jgi:hypothetical protein
VRSTESASLLMIEYRRASVAAFWLVGAAMLFLVLGTAGIAIGAAAPWQFAASIVTAILLPGVVWRQWFERGVWVWNGCTRRLVAVLSGYILRVSYIFLLTPLGASRSPLVLTLSQPDRSRWIERPHRTDERARGGVSPRDGLHHGLLEFVRTPGHLWATALFPLVFLLALTRDRRQEATPPGSTYTLY